VKVFRAFVVALTVATLVQASAVAYILGYEAGVESQLWTMKQLRERLDGIIIDFLQYTHPLRNTLLLTSLLLLICWLFAAMYVVQGKAGSKLLVESKQAPQ
jgi:hypothetical protein